MAKSLAIEGPAATDARVAPFDLHESWQAPADAAGFEQLMREHEAMVYSLAYHFLQNRTAAEDLTQEVFLGLYQNLHTIRSPAHLKYWLRQVTSRRCIDLGRKARLWRLLSLGDAPEPAGEPHLADPVMTQRVQTLVATLPAKLRIAVVLRYQEDLTPSEIATLLGIPLNTIKSSLRRSLDLLRKKLTRQLSGVDK
jgi:RNA polymerase sigma-70 factor (ECF subfamily)